MTTSMAALVSCPKHNMVACLEKTKQNAQFHEIMDFFTRSLIYYSLIVSPTVSTSLIEQFWNTATSKTVNDVSYIKAKVAGKTVLISEVSIRRDLLFNDVDGIDCLTNQRIYENLQLMRVFTNMAKQGLHFPGHVTPLFPNMLAQEVVDEGKDPRENLEGTSGSQGDHVQIPHDSPLSGGHTSDRAEVALNLAAKILNLNTRIKKLEKKCKPNISHYRAWLRSVCRLSRKKKLAHGMDYIETEEAVNEGRQSNETEELNLDVDTKVIAEDKGSGEKGGSTVSTARPEVDTTRPEVHTANAPVSTAGVTISTVDPEVSTIKPRTPPTTTSTFDDEDITMAQTLIKMKEEKAKEKGVAFKDIEDSSRPVRSITTLKPLPSNDPKDKGKGILVEEEPINIKRKDQGIDQIQRDEELAHKLHEEELAEIARIQEEKQHKKKLLELL
ncbi:hypothetical protein Tco_1303675 [Tanacetum coccineum]